MMWLYCCVTFNIEKDDDIAMIRIHSVAYLFLYGTAYTTASYSYLTLLFLLLVVITNTL